MCRSHFGSSHLGSSSVWGSGVGLGTMAAARQDGRKLAQLGHCGCLLKARCGRLHHAREGRSWYTAGVFLQHVAGVLVEKGINQEKGAVGTLWLSSSSMRVSSWRRASSRKRAQLVHCRCLLKARLGRLCEGGHHPGEGHHHDLSPGHRIEVVGRVTKS